MLFYTSPVPRAVFRLIPELKDAELRVLLIIVNKTLGYKDKTGRTKTGRKEIDWIAGSQLQEETGLSQRSIGLATDALVENMHIIVRDADGNVLTESQQRKGKKRLYYELSPSLKPICEDYDTYKRRKLAALANRLRITSPTP